MNTVEIGAGAWSGRARLRAFVDSAAFQRVITILIALNAVTLGLETSGTVMASAGGLLLAVDRSLLVVFTVEVALRIVAHGRRFFTSGWNVFDFLVVAIALVPATEGFSVLRALRILRAFRLISAVPQMRAIIEALLKSVPGLASIIVLLLILFYVFAVMATKLFGDTNPDLFGTLGRSLYALFQIMTLEGWSGDIVNPVLEHHPYALLFFLPFMLLSTFTVLNLFIALIVDSMQKLHRVEIEVHDAAEKDQEAAERRRMFAQIDMLAAEIRELRAAIERSRAPS